MSLETVRDRQVRYRPPRVAMMWLPLLFVGAIALGIWAVSAMLAP